MQNSKLIQSLRTMSKSDLKKLGQLVRCEAFNSNKKQFGLNCMLFDYIVKFAPNFTDKRLSKEAAHEHLFPKRPFDAQSIRYLLSNLFKITEDFLLFQRIKGNKTLALSELMDHYKSKQLDNHYAACYRDLDKLVKSVSYADSDAHYDAFRFHASAIGLTANRNKQSGEDPHFQEAIFNLDRFYLTEALSYSCIATLQAHVVNQKAVGLSMASDLLAHIDKHPHLDVPSVQLYRTALLMLGDMEQGEYYASFRELLGANKDLFSVEDAQNLYAYARSYCGYKINRGERQYYRDVLELYQEQFQAGLLSITPPMFKNIVTIALREGLLDWCEDFIDNTIDLIGSGEREQVLAYNQAHLKFYLSDYKGVIDLLTDQKSLVAKDRVRKFNDIFYQVDARKLLLKSYYELEDDRMEDMLANLEVFLTKHKQLIPAQSMLTNRNFVKTLKKVMRILPYDRDRAEVIEQLTAKMIDTKELAERAWLQEKLKEKG